MRRFTVCVDKPIIDYNMNRYTMNNDMLIMKQSLNNDVQQFH